MRFYVNKKLSVTIKQLLVILPMWLIPLICPATLYESGSLYQFLFGYEPGTAYDNWNSHISEGMVLPGYNTYAPWDRQTPGFGNFTFPDETQTSEWNAISHYFVHQQWTELSNALQADSLPYDLIRFNDTDTGRQYYMLREWLNRDYDDNGTETLDDDEEGSFDLGWGLFIINPQAENRIIINAPHPCDDYIAVPLAWKAFTELNARYLLINGAGRETMWTQQGVYVNSQSLSDPSRNAAHPFHITYKACADEVRELLASQSSILSREFCLQIHSYDSNHHIGYANCQVSAGNAQGCVNLPIRDLSKTQPDLINAAGYLIHPANTIGNNREVYTSNFWAVNYNLHYFFFNDGVHTTLVSNFVDLPGYSYNCQQQYSLSQWTNYDVYDPFFHIEMDELPDSYAQNDSTLAWFYGWNPEIQSWDTRTRFLKAIEYYTPWIDALETSLSHTFTMNDNQAPPNSRILNAIMPYNSTLRVTWQAIAEYDFQSWIIHLERRSYLGNGNYQVIDTLSFDRNNYSTLADPACESQDISGFPMGYHYRIWITAVDKSGRNNVCQNYVNIITYAESPYVSDFRYNQGLSDEHRITLNWTPVPDNIVVNGYRVDRRYPHTMSWIAIATLPQTASSYTDMIFTEADSLVYEYRIVTLGANGLSYSNPTSCIGYLRIYPSPVLTDFYMNTTFSFCLLWQPVSHTVNGLADTPDYYLITKSASPDFIDAQVYVTMTTSFIDPYPNLAFRDNQCFYKVTAKSGEIPARTR